MQSDDTARLKDLIKVIQRVMDTFRTREKLSEFERGQLDGLLWCVQLADEVIKKTSDATSTPEAN